jgi:hypothetical protein
VVQDVESEFDEYWNSQYACPAATLIRQGTCDELEALRAEKQAFFEASSMTACLQALGD